MRRARLRAEVALTFYYFQHDLGGRQYLGTPVSSCDWAGEINAGIAWSTPRRAAREIYGDKDFTVVQTWMSFHF